MKRWAVFTVPRTVFVLGLASLLNDAASEMVAPLLPIFLTVSLGASPLVLGVVEGVAEAGAGLLRFFGGRLLDRGVPAARLVRAGYIGSNLVRPLIALARAWPWVLVLRLLDRAGHGLRSAPRDAMIAAVVAPQGRGAAFGLQRSMDHAGAVIGPLLAAAVLALGGSLPTVFLASAIPGVIVMVMLWLALPTLPVPAVLVNAPIHWSALDRRLWGLLGAALLLSFAAVPEAFLMIWAGRHGIAVAELPLLWACTSVAKMLMAAPSGRLSDRFGRLPVLLVAWSGRVAVLASLGGAVGTGASVVALVVAYGACLAVAEPAERALIADVAPPAHRGTLYGAYYVVSGIGILPGATAFGALWLAMGPAIAFYAAAAVSAVAAIAMLLARAAKQSAAE